MIKIIVYFDNISNCEENNMCKTLEKLHGQTAENLLKKYWHGPVYPVDIVSVVHNIGGIELGSANFSVIENTEFFRKAYPDKKEILGSVIVCDDDIQISYSNKLSSKKNKKNNSFDSKEALLRRQRFTIAHEIAHCCLHMDPINDKLHIEFRTDQTNETDVREVESNIFAGELLVPFRALTETLYDDSICPNKTVSYSHMANLFRVSKHVIKGRLKHLCKQGWFTDLKYTD